jgi:hypothetical protein
MKLKIFAAAALMSVVGTGAFASNACGLNQARINAGWTCVPGGTEVVDKQSYTSTEQLGASGNCAVYSRNGEAQLWNAVNPAQNIAETFVGAITWGDWYRDGAARCSS